MDNLLDDQTDYEKKIRNYKADLEKNIADRSTEQTLFGTEQYPID